MPQEDKRKLAEVRYVCGDISLTELAKEVDVKYHTLWRWCQAGEWAKKRQALCRQAMKKAAAKAVNKKARELCRLLEASDEMENALQLAARAIAKKLTEDPEGLQWTDGRMRAGDLTHIAQAIGRQTETRMLLSGIMTQADQEKINLMRKRQALDEQKEARQAPEGAAIRMEEGVEEASE